MTASHPRASGSNAYTQTIRETEDPRQIERRVLARVTHALEAHLTPDRDGRVPSAAAHEALAQNQTLWGKLMFDAADERNALPDALKARIISLALFVDRHTTAVLGGTAGVAALVDLNRAIMDGLDGRQPVGPEGSAGHGA